LIQVTVAGTPIAIANTSLLNGQRDFTLVPAFPLAPGTLHTFAVSGVRDIAGNTIAPVNLTFTTGPSASLAGSILQTVFPANGSSGIPVSVNPSFTFTAAGPPLDGISATVGVRLRLFPSSVIVPSTFSVSADARTITLIPVSPLTPNTQYFVNYDSNLVSVAGAFLTPNSSGATFTTAP